ncbi:MAG: PIN domain-containing protein [Solirubrobacterales bacterium]|nr:PIN domain-containing protein [Solirubrobacterales bacterium]
MITFLLDASVWLSALDPLESGYQEASDFIAAGRAGSFKTAALDLTLYEVANVATASWSKPEVGVTLAAEIELACVGRLLRADSDLMRAATTMATAHQISVYDAAYAAAGQACRWPVVSFDTRDLVSNGLAILPRDALN